MLLHLLWARALLSHRLAHWVCDRARDILCAHLRRGASDRGTSSAERSSPSSIATLNTLTHILSSPSGIFVCVCVRVRSYVCVVFFRIAPRDRGNWRQVMTFCHASFSGERASNDAWIKDTRERDRPTATVHDSSEWCVAHASTARGAYYRDIAVVCSVCVCTRTGSKTLIKRTLIMTNLMKNKYLALR